MRKPPQKFTLIELVVVVGVAALLLGIAVTAAHGAVAAAKAASCTDKLSSMGNAVKLYAADNADYVPAYPRKNKAGKMIVDSFGPGLYEHSWGHYLIWGGYFGEKPQPNFDKGIEAERLKYFVCPDDPGNYKGNRYRGSYFIHVLDPEAAIQNKRYGGEQYARIRIGRDRPENSVAMDIFAYRGGMFKQPNHAGNVNLLRLGGEVENVDSTPVTNASNAWDAMGEYWDGIEL